MTSTVGWLGVAKTNTQAVRQPTMYAIWSSRAQTETDYRLSRRRRRWRRRKLRVLNS